MPKKKSNEKRRHGTVFSDFGVQFKTQFIPLNLNMSSEHEEWVYQPNANKLDWRCKCVQTMIQFTKNVFLIFHFHFQNANRKKVVFVPLVNHLIFKFQIFWFFRPFGNALNWSRLWNFNIQLISIKMVLTESVNWRIDVLCIRQQCLLDAKTWKYQTRIQGPALFTATKANMLDTYIE